MAKNEEFDIEIWHYENAGGSTIELRKSNDDTLVTKTTGNEIIGASGHRATNEIIEMANPGTSDYVLQQNGHYTEYQINLTTEL